MRKIKVLITSVTVSTENVFFPISWRLNISLYDGDYTMSNKYKIMPGSVFKVGEGANLTIKELGIYSQQAFDEYTASIGSIPAPKYKTNAGDAQFIIESGATVIVTGAVGGKITNNGGTFTNNGASTITCNEVNNLSGSSFSSSCTVYSITLPLTIN